MRTAFKTIYYSVLGIIIATGLLLIISIFPFQGNIKFLVVASGSMEPTIKTGSVVMVKPQATYAIGDIITFGTSSATPPVTHRIVEIRMVNTQQVFITRGDANNGADNHQVSAGEIRGSVRFWIPYAGYLITALKLPLVFAFIIIIPALYLVYGQVQNIIAEAKTLRTKRYATQEKKRS